MDVERHGREIRMGLCKAGFLLILATAGCGGGRDGSIDFCQGSNEVIFDPAGDWLLPFPSDLYLAEDPSTPSGHRVVLDESNIPPAEESFTIYPYLAGQMSELDGFGTSADIAFGFSTEIGAREMVGGELVVTPPQSLQIGPADTVGPASPALLVDVDEDSPGFGQPVPLFLEYVSDRTPEGAGQHYLMAEPAWPLRPKTTYALALTRRLTDARGRCVAPSAATRDLLSGRTPGRFGLLGERAPGALDVLEEEGFIQGPGDLAALTVFTTQSIDEQLLSAAAAVLDEAARNPPRVVEESLESTPGTDGVALVVTGRFEAPTYLGPDGTFVFDDGLPVRQGTVELEFELVLPAPAEGHPPPWPVIIYQHGLTGHKGQDMGAKRAQARAGFASLAIDAVLHGSRAAASGMDVLNFFAIDLESGAFDMPVLRDNFRQSYLDIVWLAELVPALAGLDLLPQGEPDGVPELAAAPVLLSGHSLGSIIACGGLVLSPRIPAGNLSAGGGRLTTNLFMRSELLGTFIDMLRPEGTTAADIRRFMPLLQMLVERGDPVNLGVRAAEAPFDLAGGTPRHVLLQEVTDDGIVPNAATESLARALGLSHVGPVHHAVYGLEQLAAPASCNHPSGVTAGFYQFDRLADGQPADHTEIYADPLAQAQWIHFFATLLEEDCPEVVRR